jgi:superfamily I DNA/RNA helicase
MIRTDRWSPSQGLSLEPNALRAAREIEHSLALTAGPGAGKTEMLAQRADFLLRTGTCRFPRRILAISFKVDASHNLKARVARRCTLELAARMDSYTFHAFAKRIIDRFRVVLTGQDALDPDYSIGLKRVHRRVITFADMVPLALNILQASAIARKAVRQTYSHVFLDEFQDCTEGQYRLIRACFLGTDVKLTAVGDTKQRIMGWAGALEGIFETYAADFHAVSLNLYQNFRAQPRLRRMQNAMIRVMDPAAAVDEKELVGQGGEIEITQFDDDTAEAAYLAQSIRDWVSQDGVSPSDIAVLVSKQQNLYCETLRAALTAAGIPYREEDSAQDLAAEPACRLIIDFLMVAAGSQRSEPHRRLLDLLVFGHGLDDEREYQARSKWDRFIASVRKRITSNAAILSDKQQLAGLVDELLAQVGRDSLVALSPEYARGDRLQQVLGGTIDRVFELTRQEGDIVAVLATFSGDTAVRIMSIHKSKGLEFDSVIVLGVESETFWGKPDEERSAYFVAISRAKRRLILTHCDQRARPDGAFRWATRRSPHDEFLGYAAPYIR